MFLIFAFVAAVMGAAVPAYEREALIALYASAGGDKWNVNSGWKEKSEDTCKWFGVACGEVENVTRITSVSLPGNNMQGKIPEQFGWLNGLTYFDFGGNALEGELPASCANLTRMFAMSLRGNKMTGPLPKIAPPMQFCHLDNNKFTGDLSVFSDCKSLKVLGLTDNEISGTIPDFIASNTVLQTLFLGGNKLTGTVPTFKATALTGLDLSRNSLTGNIPLTNIMALPSLQEMLLFSNKFDGDLSKALATESLVVIDMHNNKLTGELPDVLAKGQTNGLILHLQKNGFSGKLSETFVKSNIYDIDLSDIPFTCPLPDGAADKTGASCTNAVAEKVVPKMSAPVKEPVKAAAPVDVHIHGMSKCPDEGSILTIFSDVVNTLGEDVVNVTLGWIAEESSDYPTGFWSLHGQTEVVGNAMFSCAASMYGMKAALNYATCMSVNISSIPLNNPYCAKQNNMDADLLKECAFSESGKNFVRKGIELSRQDVAIWSPSIYINGEMYCLWHSLPCKATTDKDFGKYICEVYTGTRPAGCAKYN